ncbi:MAG: ribosome biogenesis GTP-binding protein YihA/YsxC [Arenicella sp.]
MSQLPALLQHPEFLDAAAKPSQWPEGGIEVAFAGRSNVGKSSAINTIMHRKKLARTSKTPGRTQQIVFFSLTESQRVVDLPGYGFAKVPIEVRKAWEVYIGSYITERKCLKGLVQLMDVRHPLTDLDQQMLLWCADIGLPVHIMLTKADKLKFGAAKNTLLKVAREIEALGVECTLQLFSSHKNIGVDDCRAQLLTWLEGNKVD